MTREVLGRIPWEDKSVEHGEHVQLNPEGTRGFGYRNVTSRGEKGAFSDKVLRFFVKSPSSLFSVTVMAAVTRRYTNGETTEFIEVYSRRGSPNEATVVETYGMTGVRSGKAAFIGFSFGIDHKLIHDNLPITGDDLPPIIDTQATRQALYDQARAGNFATPQLIPPSTP